MGFATSDDDATADTTFGGVENTTGNTEEPVTDSETSDTTSVTTDYTTNDPRQSDPTGSAGGVPTPDGDTTSGPSGEQSNTPTSGGIPTTDPVPEEQGAGGPQSAESTTTTQTPSQFRDMTGNTGEEDSPTNELAEQANSVAENNSGLFTVLVLAVSAIALVYSVVFN